MRLTVVLLGCLAAESAWAADLDPFHVAGSLVHANGTVQGEAPRLAGDGVALALLASISEDLAVLEYPSGRREPLLGTALATTLYGAYTWNGKARFELYVPTYAFVDAPYGGYRGVGFGDVMVQALVPVYELNDRFALGVVPKLGLPTGQKKAYLARGIDLGVTATAGGTFDFGLGWLANLGVTLSPAEALEGVTLGSSFDALGGVYYTLDDGLRFGADANLGVGLPRQEDTRRVVRGEGHVFAQVFAQNGIALTVGGGTGAGVGAPAYRMFGSISWAPVKLDKDRDGITDKLDACPLEPEDLDGYQDDDGCIDPDDDGDGILDTADACRTEAEDFDSFEDTDGCPEPDNDKDGVLDAADRCPIEAGTVAGKGCPDEDGDGYVDLDDECPHDAGASNPFGCPDADDDVIPDYRDKCPDKAVPEDADPKRSDGCPGKAYASKTGVTITERVEFATGSATITRASFPVLDAVVAVLKENPTITKIEVQGHTDNQGSRDDNVTLSQKRAEAVVAYLVKKGIDEDRLIAKGYGPDKPRDTNRTTAGRQNNRRVEFVAIVPDENPWDRP